jgi:large subunit ribosomal protein L21
MQYAIIKTQGKQYVVSEKDTLVIDRLTEEAGKTVTFDEVLLVSENGKTVVGAPTVAKATVTAKVLSHDRGTKIRVATFKAKSRYRKVRGHRQEQTTVQIESIKA